MLLKIALLLAPAAIAAAAEGIYVWHPNGGYDLYDGSRTLIVSTSVNSFGSYDVFDAQGFPIQSGKTTANGNVEFGDSDHTLYQTYIADYSGNYTSLDAFGKIMNYASDNYLGGVDFYDEHGVPSMITTYDEKIQISE